MSERIVILVIVEAGFDIFDSRRNKPLPLPVQFQLFTDGFSSSAVWPEGCPCSMAETDMFRISTVDTRRERRLVVEGTLVHPWVDELQKTWSNAGNSLEDRSLVIDLINVTVISRDGENAIFELMKQGAKFSCGGVLTRHLLKELAHRCHTKLQDVLNRRRFKE